MHPNVDRAYDIIINVDIIYFFRDPFSPQNPIAIDSAREYTAL